MLAAVEAEWQAQAEQLSAAAHAHSVERTGRHPGAVYGGEEAGAEEGAESSMANEFAELFAQQRTVQGEPHARAGEDEGPEAVNDDKRGDKDEKQADEEEEGKGGKYGRPWMWGAAASVVLGLYFAPSLAPVLDTLKSNFESKAPPVAEKEFFYVVTDVANIREKASTNSRIVSRVAFASKLTEVKRIGSWVKVITDGGKEPVGWIHASLLTTRKSQRR